MNEGYAKAKEDEVSSTEAAEILGAHPETLRRWGKEVVSGGKARITKVRRDLFGRYWFHRSEIIALSTRDLDEYY